MVLISEHEKRPFSLVRMTANFSTRHRPCERERATEHDEYKTQSYPLVPDVHASSSGRPQWAIILWRQASLKSAKNCWIKKSEPAKGRRLGRFGGFVGRTAPAHLLLKRRHAASNNRTDIQPSIFPNPCTSFFSKKSCERYFYPCITLVPPKPSASLQVSTHDVLAMVG